MTTMVINWGLCGFSTLYTEYLLVHAHVWPRIRIMNLTVLLCVGGLPI